MYERILVPVDGSAPSLLGLNQAIEMAAQSPGSQLFIHHIVNEMVFDSSFSAGAYMDRLIDSLRQKGQEILADAAKTARKRGLQPECVLEESIGGVAAELIVNLAKKCAADVIVMGTHGRRGIRRIALGSDAETVVRLSPVPVLLVRATPAV